MYGTRIIKVGAPTAAYMYGIIVNDLVLDRSYPHPVGSTRTDKTFYRYRYRAHAELYYGTV